MKILELFCGTKSISKVFKEKRHQTYTVDFDKQFNPDLCINILDFEIKMLPKEFRKPDVIWASPPCTTFSVAAIYRYWVNSKPKTSKTYIGLAIASKTFEIIQEFNPKYWFIENPRGMLRNQHFVKKYLRKTLTYCQYGSKVQKPTDIWTNASSWIPKKVCSPGDNCHEKAARSSRNGTQGIVNNDYYDSRDAIMRAVIPKKLCEEIVDVCEGKQKVRQTNLRNIQTK